MDNEQFNRFWCKLDCCERGTRDNNQDRILSVLLPSSQGGPAALFVACDGLGGIPDGDICAEWLCQKTFNRISELVTREGRRLFYASQHSVLSEALLSLNEEPFPQGASTLVVLLLCMERFADGYRGKLFWCGDSRAYCLNDEGALICLTEDHHDSERAITHLFWNGFRGIPQEKNFVLARKPLLFGVTTDGLHDKCTHDELQKFLVWCLSLSNRCTFNYQSAVRYFLEENLSDNASSAFFMTRRPGISTFGRRQRNEGAHETF